MTAAGSRRAFIASVVVTSLLWLGAIWVWVVAPEARAVQGLALSGCLALTITGGLALVAADAAFRERMRG